MNHTVVGFTAAFRDIRFFFDQSNVQVIAGQLAGYTAACYSATDNDDINTSNDTDLFTL